MAVGVTPVRVHARTGREAWPSLIEAVLVAVVVVALLPLFSSLASHEAGRDARFTTVAPAAHGSPAPSAAASADARSERVNSAKNEAMRTLLRTAGWQWATWALLGLALLNVQRSPIRRIVGIALALAGWAAVAWIFRVPWPLGTVHTLVPARSSDSWTALPANFVLCMLAISLVLLVIAPFLRQRGGREASLPASVTTYPGLVAATGLGWLVLLDLSANGNFGNRYLALYHQGHLWLGMLTFTLVAMLRRPIGRSIAFVLALTDAIASRVARAIGGVSAGVIFFLIALAITALVASGLSNMPQLTSELGRFWLVVGAAWFFFMRGTPLTERLAHGRNSLASLAKYVWPLVFVVMILIAAMILTRDMGPLLVAGYAAGAFIAASVAMWLYQRRGTSVAAYLVAVLVFVAWIAVTTLALFKLGAIDRVAAERLENASTPFLSVNDQLALVTWFQRAAPPTGFGPGAVPWCGFGAQATCPGVPAQIQSDYTFTALVGMFGWIPAWAITLAIALWLYQSVFRHGAASRGEPRLVRIDGRMRNDEQSLVSWICVAWVMLALCQLAVTVAGNLAVIPLTGVTFPFVSFGMTSLLANMAMLALAIDVNAPRERR
jgi:cell division protein FtsW (lipid II flippase)